ncbi:serine/threonine protein kinase [Bradymonas sediminis]|nr:serine/threonine protein kinase [Bradymonas sediminis]
MGEVWRAVHRADGLEVGIKVLTSQGAHQEEFVRLFRNEIRAVAALDHPGIVRVLDMNAVDAAAQRSSGGRLSAGSPYLVMELAKRGSLDRYVPNTTWPIIRHVLLKVLDALAHAHARGVVHRDLKPQNLLVGCDADDPLGLKIADFGLAHPMDLTGRTGQFEQGWGTPHYMAPEQFRGQFRDYGPATDLYALGVVGWELTTGALPFDSDSPVELSALHLHRKLPVYRPRLEVPAGFEGWLRRLLQKDFRERFPSAAHAAYSLRVILGNNPAFDVADDYDIAGTGEPPPGLSQQLKSQGSTHLLRPSADAGDNTTRHGVADTTRLIDFGDPDGDDMLQVIEEMDAATRAVSPGAVAAGYFEQEAPGRDAAQNAEDEEVGEALAEIVSPQPPVQWEKRGRIEPAPQLLGAGLGLFGLRTVRMVDRQSERDALWATLRQMHRDFQPRVVILRGSTGTGKSRLSRWLCERASEVGAAKVLTATHSQMDSPSDGLAALFARHYGCVGLNRHETERRLRTILEAEGVTEPYEWRALTEYISPFNSNLAANDPSVERVRLTSEAQRFSLLRRAVERVARKQPLIICFEDIHWSAESLAWMQFLMAGDAIRVPIMLVATAHEDLLAECPRERESLEALAKLECAQTHRILPLNAEDTAELVRRLLLLEGGLAEQVEERSGGNPLFAVQLVGDWVSTGKLKVGERGFCLEEGGEVTIPDGVHQIWRARLKYVLDRSANPDHTRQALELAAAFGVAVDRAEWRHACAAAGLAVDEALEDTLFEHALAQPGRDDASDRQSRTLVDSGWRFAHRMLRESLQRLSVEANRWELLNSIGADTLDALYPESAAHAERRAHYLRQAGRLAEAAVTLMSAVRYRSQRSELSRAHELLDELEALLDTLEANAALMPASLALPRDWLSRERARGWLHRSEIFGWSGRFKRALKFGNLAADAAEKLGSVSLISPAYCALANAHLHLGNYDVAQSAFERAREAERAAVPQLPAYQRGLSTLGLARVRIALGAFGDAQELLHGAREIFEECGDSQSLARCYNALGDVARKVGELEQARAYSVEARGLFASGGNQIGVADCLNDLGELYYLLGDPQAAESHVEDALRLYESIGSKRAMGVRLNLALLWIERREFERARQLLVNARDHFERERQRSDLAHASILLLACAAHHHDWVIWNALFAQAEELRRSTGMRDPHIARAAAVAAQVTESAGDPARAAKARALSEAFECE